MARLESCPETPQVAPSPFGAVEDLPLRSLATLQAPVLVAMEDAPGKPDPTGLLQTVEMLEKSAPLSIVIYAGDTVADMYTVENARQIQPHRQWVGVGVLPPHVQEVEANALAYATRLQQAGATIVLKNVEELTPEKVAELVLKT